jgi:hypothetical protein
MDIDIDLPTTFQPEDYFEITKASMVKDGKLIKHPAGVYFQNIPIDPVTHLSAIPYKQAEEYGFTKIDFLHLAILDDFDSKKDIRALLKIPPDWSLLCDRTNVEKLFQVHKHFGIVNTTKPTSVIALADTIALIRPAKRHLLERYLQNPKDVRCELYSQPTDGRYYYKKSHAVAYAHIIVLQLHLIAEGIL